MHGNKVNDELIHSSRLFELRRIELDSGKGSTVKRDLVVHPGAALILPVMDDGSIVMIRNYRFAVSETLWELPCGTLEPPEDPVHCAIRELTEETGYTAEDFQPLCEFYSCPGFTTENIYAFLATGLTEGKQQLDETEDISVEMIDDDRVRRMAAGGEIHDAKTLAALCVYWNGRSR